MTGPFYPAHDDARYPGTVCVHYSFHPFYGRGELLVRRSYGVRKLEQVDVEVDGRRQAVPVWMTDAACCARMTFGDTPFCEWDALVELLSLLCSTSW